ncbi:hypothetical protein ElyMa_002626700 [Elysia marginata]|uniref:Uncharacterized protein n=1 Tax=Elysia marginata TaxID=1093978 RepID=A0AAV4H4F2_9GAST|nr:hypothetical protein ElyMa_002626700 [Elysia marginata]
MGNNRNSKDELLDIKNTSYTTVCTSVPGFELHRIAPLGGVHGSDTATWTTAAATSRNTTTCLHIFA